MKAAWYTRNGEAKDVLTVGEMPDPVAGPGEVLVRLATSGVNPSDVKSRRGRPLSSERIIPHSDGAGIVTGVGPGVPAGRIGQRVWIWNGQWQRPLGTCAGYVAVPQAQAVPLADHIDFEAAACFGIPLLTAIQAVRLAGAPTGELAGKTVLVTGAANAVGHYVTQLARMQGAHVIGTVGSEARARHAESAGAAETVNYKTEDVAQRVQALTGGRGADVLIDMDFSSTARLLAQGVLRPHGLLVCYGSNDAGDVPVNFRSLLWGSIALKFFLVYDLLPEDRTATLGILQDLLARNVLRHAVAQVYPLDQVVAAHEAVESGQVIGNVVISLG